MLRNFYINPRVKKDTEGVTLSSKIADLVGMIASNLIGGIFDKNDDNYIEMIKAATF